MQDAQTERGCSCLGSGCGAGAGVGGGDGVEVEVGKERQCSGRETRFPILMFFFVSGLRLV
jgi:hypothetical protein